MSFRHPSRAARFAAFGLIAPLVLLAAPHGAWALTGLTPSTESTVYNNGGSPNFTQGATGCTSTSVSFNANSFVTCNSGAWAVQPVITGLIYPTGDSTTAIQFDKANGSSNVLDIDTTNGRVGIGSTSPLVSLDLSQKVDALALPVGTNGGRPIGGNLVNGEIRYNSSIPGLEAYVNGGWSNIMTSTVGTSAPEGSGTANYVARWTATTTLGTGTLYDNGSAVGIGTTSPQATLDVNGAMMTECVTVSTLPTGKKGMRHCVTDATSCTFLGALTGSGSTFCPVVYNGSAWVGG